MLFILFYILCGFTTPINGKPEYTHDWAVEIAGSENEAKVIASKHNFEYRGKIFDNVYHFSQPRIAKRSLETSYHYQNRLTQESAVRWAEQQKVKRRFKRDYLSYKSPSSRSISDNQIVDNKERHAFFTDPKWSSMWYLNRGSGLDMNVEKAWQSGITGKGVVVTILDDGIEKDHPDLIQNYDPYASYDVNGHDPDPMPRYDLIDSNRHGTRCAGEVAALANNSVCSVGVAYGASVGGVRMLDGDVTDVVEAKSLSLNPQHIDIFSASWGPDDDGKTVDGPGQLATRAFMEGVKNGRSGKGSIFVWASGNGGRDEDNCNCDGYTNSIWTLSISSATERGKVPWYSEACSSTLATTYSSGAMGERQIVTTDLHHGCTMSHTGTSASAPLAAGICALALHANRDLTWRDMQHIVLRTARPENLYAPDWQTNGVGRKVSHRFGYGLMDAYGMVQLAKNWTTVPPQHRCEVPSFNMSKAIPQKSYVTLALEVSECAGVNYLEHVQAKVTMSTDRRGDIEIFLISPAGTKSNILAMRHRDSSRAGFHSWPFMTVHMWGESPLGIWKLEIHNNGVFYSQNSWVRVDFRSVTEPFIVCLCHSPPVYFPIEAFGFMVHLPRSSSAAAEANNWTLIFYGTETEPGLPKKDPHPFNIDPLDTNSIAETDTQNSDGSRTEERKKGRERGNVSTPSKSTPLHEPRSNGARSPAAVLNFACLRQNRSGSCIECSSGFFLHENSCLRKCPEKTFLVKADNRCESCHYSCLSCSGPFDYECTKCWPDALIYEPRKSESYCESQSFITSYARQKSLVKVSLILFFLLLICTIALFVYVFRNNFKARNNGHVIFPNQNVPPFNPVRLKPVVTGARGLVNGFSNKVKGVSMEDMKDMEDRDILVNKPFHDLTSDSEEEL